MAPATTAAGTTGGVTTDAEATPLRCLLAVLVPTALEQVRRTGGKLARSPQAMRSNDVPGAWNRRILGLTALVGMAALLALPAFAQDEDHLLGFRTRDGNAVAPSASSYVFTSSAYAHQNGCELNKKPLFHLLQVDKDGGDDPRGGPAGEFVCYKAKCRKGVVPGASPLELESQFGEHALDDKRARIVCLPVGRLVAELKAAGLGKYLSRPVPTLTDDAAGWQRYDYAPSDDGPICLRGTPYKLWVRPGTINKVLVYLEGGGGCSNDESCNLSPTAKESADPIAPLAALSGFGVLASDDENPYAGWHVVYVPYCDGGSFASDNVVDYANGRVHHRGLANLSAAVDVLRDRFPAPEEITVSGTSAGGFGTFPGYGVVRIAYPDTPILVLNDSGPGLSNAGALSRREAQRNLRARDVVPPSCAECGDQLAFLIDWWLARDPQLRVGLFSYLEDWVVAGFLDLSGQEYETLMRDVTTEIQARHPDRFKRFLLRGESHTILRGAGLSREGLGTEGNFTTVAIDGTRLVDWLADFIVDGPRWRDLVDPDTP